MYFEKVSKRQWIEDGGHPNDYEDIKLPKQGTACSMGMDFFAPHDIVIPSGESITIPTGVRWVIDQCDAEHLGLIIVPRSSLGFKYNLRLAGTLGIIDGDYHGAENEGHIMIKLHNPSSYTAIVEKGNGFVQGIMTTYYICEGAESEEIRVGGFGSTTK